MHSLEFLLYCVKSECFFQNSHFIACYFDFFDTFYEFIKSHSCTGINVWKPLDSEDGGDTWSYFV